MMLPRRDPVEDDPGNPDAGIEVPEPPDHRVDTLGCRVRVNDKARRYEKSYTVFTSNKSYGEWGEIFGDHVIAAAVLDRILHHCTTINIKGDSYRLKERRKQGLFSHTLPV
ncbi:MAG: hypothetical protein STSR0009_19800 [Methanoregula sp.]